MSQEARHIHVEAQTQSLLQGPLKHARAAALAAALLPLASVLASPAAAQSVCPSAGICGFVFNDANNNGIQDAGETAISGAVVTSGSMVTFTDVNGFYYFAGGPGTYAIEVQITPGTQPSPTNVGSNDAVDSDGVSDNLGNSVATVTLLSSGTGMDTSTDFGFWVPSVSQPGTGT